MKTTNCDKNQAQAIFGILPTQQLAQVDFKSVHGAPEEIFRFEGSQIPKLGLFFEGF